MNRQYLYSLFFVPIVAMRGQDIIQEVIRNEQGLLDRVVYLNITENSHHKIKEVDFHDNGNKFRSKSYDKTGEVKIIKDRHLSEDVKTLDILGKELKISKERVRQIEKGAMMKMKSYISNSQKKEFLF